MSPKAAAAIGGVEAGLTCSAPSDTCAMGVLLAKLPFNRDVPQPAPDQVIERVRRREPGPVH